MAVPRGFKSFDASILDRVIVLSIASLLMLVSCGESPPPSEREGTMTTPGCSGQDKLAADKVAIDSFNYGYNIGRGVPVDPNELNRIQQEYARLSPPCQQYVTSIGERLQEMNEAGKIRQQIDKLPW